MSLMYCEYASIQYNGIVAVLLGSHFLDSPSDVTSNRLETKQGDGKSKGKGGARWVE
jgi:hypothetical protein